MFDIGFVELLLVGIVGLVVLGPERLPEAIRQVALYIGRFKRMYRSVRADIEKEVGTDEIRRQLHNEDIMQSIKSGKDELNSVAETINKVCEEPTMPANDSDSGTTSKSIADRE